MSRLMVQISVMRNNEDNQLVAFTTWVPVDKRLKVGSIIEFKDPLLKQHKWTITHIYDKELEMDSIDYHGWDNNNYDKHKGLNI
jgi:hypothetical protein